MNDSIVNQRSQQVLKILVERYIQDGLPVGSKTIAEDYALGLSSASIRNILSDLEDAGYLISPHTSAGRIPTEQGYRYFVNSLLTTQPFTNLDLHDLKTQLDPDQDISHIVQSASSVLSGLTQLIGVVAMPRRNRIQLRQVEFLPLSGNRVLVILVLNNREVQNRIIYTDRTYSASDLQQAANYLNAHYAGKDLLTARRELREAMQNDRENVAKLLQAVVDVANKAFETTQESNKNYVMAGESHLLKSTQQQDDDIARLQVLFNAFTQKQEILNLLDHSLEAEGVQIFIGKESGYAAFNHCSIVTSSYAVDGQLVGSLGVIGPTRMAYDKVISAVDVTAKLLSAALNQG
jgi:heat-inducible transcriptional repressor